MRKPQTPEQKAAKAEYDRAYRAANRARVAQSKKNYALLNAEKEQARVNAWVAANQERSREIKAEWKRRNPDADTSPESRARRAEYMRQYRRTKPETHRRAMSLRRAKVSHATPMWADKSAIKAIYSKARSSGLHVDHVVPLAGKNVCGLHVESNLQLLSPKQNRSKGNRHAD